MRAQSYSTITLDAYRAGCEIGAMFRNDPPELVIVITSIVYADRFDDLRTGLLDTLERPDTLVFGGTGDGIYETARVTHHGVAALGLHSGGTCRWNCTVVPGVGTRPFECARDAGQQLIGALGGRPDFVFVLADGVTADGTQVVEGVSSVIDVPFFGGLVGDDRKFKHSHIYAHGRVWQDAVAILGARGHIPWVAQTASGWTPTGEAALVEAVNGSIIERIGGQTALDFMRSQLGSNPRELELGVVPFATYPTADSGHFSLRSSSSFDIATGHVTVFGSIPQGTPVRVCQASREDVMRGVDTALSVLDQRSIEPIAAIVVSCAGRKWILDDRTHEEVDRVLARVGRPLPLVGFPSFGEIGPFRNANGSYSRTHFHNVTYVVCILGA